MESERLEERWNRELAAKGRILPDYGNYSTSSLPGAIRAVLEGRRFENDVARFVGKENRERVLLIVLDGLGYTALAGKSGKLPFFDGCRREGKMIPVTTVFPSTTAAAITTLHTGKLPGEHGMIEWHLYLKELGLMVQSLPFIPSRPDDQLKFEKLRPSARVLCSCRTVYSRLARRGVRSAVLQPASITDSSFSRIIANGADRLGYANLGEAARKLDRLLLDRRHGFVNFYYPGIDSAGHLFGPSSKEYAGEMGTMDSFLSHAAKAAAENGFTTVITSDHGQVDVNPRNVLLLDEIDGFNSRLALNRDEIIQPYGSPRDVIVDAAEDQEEFRSWLKGALGENSEVFTSDSMISEGYFGKSISGVARDRISDLWILPRGQNVVWYRHYTEETLEFKGMHGGTSLEEMIVPLAVL